jgi:hypothetical protein
MDFTNLLSFSFQLPNHLFEELAMDVYDEVDRRENDERKDLSYKYHIRKNCTLVAFWYNTVFNTHKHTHPSPTTNSNWLKCLSF